MDFVNLHNHTEYSILDGMISIPELVSYAKQNGQSAIAMTDHGVMGGFWQLYKEATRQGIKPLIGCEFYLVESMDEEERKHETRYHFLALAKNNIGLKNLFKLSTKGHLEGLYKGKPRVLMDWILQHREGVIFTSACMAGPLGELIANGKERLALAQAKQFREYFGDDFYIEIQPNKIPEQIKINPVLVRIAERLNIPLIATADAHYLKEQVNTHPILLGIQSGGRIWSFDDNCFHLMTGEEMFNLMKLNHPLLDDKTIIKAVENTVKIAEKCDVEVKRNHHVIPSPYPKLKTEEEEYNHLVKLCEHGWEKKNLQGKRGKPEYQERLQRELKSIRELKFVRYFLVVHDLYNNCVIPKGIMHGPGRGSSAGSLVCCLLNITDPDPIEHGLIFERFIAPNRVTEPDIDMDFEDSRRQEIKDYLIEKYGANCVANIGTYGTLKGKAVLRDVSRVLKVPIADVEKVTPFIIQRSGGDARASNTIEDTFAEFDEAKRFDRKHPEVLPHCRALEGRIRQKGIHAAGVLIAPFNLTDAMPLEVRGGAITAAIDGNEADELGFLKLDCLGLKTLSVIREAIDEIGITRDELANLDYNDPRVLQKFAEGDTTGVFQFSSVGMADTLKEMPIDSFEDLVSMNALYRPGGMRSGICRDFIERKKGAKVEKVDPFYDKITENTYGLIVYQEQVMRIFADMARYPAIEVDAMRKKVAKAHGVEEMEEQRETFLQGCVGNSVDKKIADEIFTKILHFGSYGFNRSHAVVYSQIAYWTQWLKVYYPLEFYVASLNCERDEAAVRELLGKAEREGYKILLPCAHRSRVNFSTEVLPDGQKAIRCALVHIKGIGEKTAREIERCQPFSNEKELYEKANRRVCHKGILRILREVGAWDDINTEEEWDRIVDLGLYPLPVADREIEKAKELASYFDVQFVDIDEIDFSKNDFTYCRGIFSGINYARIGDFGPPSPYSRWKLGDRYCMADLIDGTAHIRVKFDPDKYEKYKDVLRIGQKVIIHGRIIKDIKMIFAQFIVILDEEEIMAELAKTKEEHNVRGKRNGGKR